MGSEACSHKFAQFARVRTVRTILEKVGFSAQRYGFKLLSKTRNFHQVVYNFHRIVLKAQNLERLKMSEIFIPTYFIIGAIWWAFRLGFAHDGSEIILLAPVIVPFWPLDIAYGLGQGLRK